MGLTPAQKREWLASKGVRCPYCKSADLEAGSRDFDADYAAVKTLCLTCRRQWTEIYTLSDLLDEDGQPVVDDTGEPEPCDECADTRWPEEKHEPHCSLHQDNLVADAPVVTGIPITVVVEGGVIQDILDIPAGMQVVVRDYDVEGLDDPDVETDDDGNEYVRSVWARGIVIRIGKGELAAGRVVPPVVVDGGDEPADQAVMAQAAEQPATSETVFPPEHDSRGYEHCEDGTPTNRQRAAWAKAALETFRGVCNADDGTDVNDDIVNLITDLMHLADQESNHDDDKAVELVRIAGDAFLAERGTP